MNHDDLILVGLCALVFVPALLGGLCFRTWRGAAQVALPIWLLWAVLSSLLFFSVKDSEFRAAHLTTYAGSMVVLAGVVLLAAVAGHLVRLGYLALTQRGRLGAGSGRLP